MSTRSLHACGSAVGLALALGSALSSQALVPQESEAPPAPPLRLFELRRYSTKPGDRERLLDMFEGDFLDAYEAGGTRESARWHTRIQPELERRATRAPEVLRLRPTYRSPLR